MFLADFITEMQQSNLLSTSQTLSPAHRLRTTLGSKVLCKGTGKEQTPKLEGLDEYVFCSSFAPTKESQFWRPSMTRAVEKALQEKAYKSWVKSLHVYAHTLPNSPMAHTYTLPHTD